jgi:hypothetical protein
MKKKLTVVGHGCMRILLQCRFFYHPLESRKKVAIAYGQQSLASSH